MSAKVFLNTLIVLLLAAGFAFSQQDRGTFVGTVSDPSGAAIPGVNVTLIHTQTNAKYETLTNEVGSYRVPNLPIGDYKIVFEIAGFKSASRDGLRLSVTNVTRVDVNLEIGQATESVVVTSEAPVLQTETPEVGTLLGTKQVIDMPLGFAGGRYAEDFAYRLTPGVSGNNWTSSINGSPCVFQGGRSGRRLGHHLHRRAHGRIQRLAGGHRRVQGADLRHERRVCPHGRGRLQLRHEVRHEPIPWQRHGTDPQ